MPGRMRICGVTAAAGILCGSLTLLPEVGAAGQTQTPSVRFGDTWVHPDVRTLTAGSASNFVAATRASTSTAWHHSGTGHTDLPIADDIAQLDSTAPADVWAVGAQSWWRFDGSAWSAGPTPPSNGRVVWVHDLPGSPVLTVVQRGTALHVLRWDGSAWADLGRVGTSGPDRILGLNQAPDGTVRVAMSRGAAGSWAGIWQSTAAGGWTQISPSAVVLAADLDVGVAELPDGHLLLVATSARMPDGSLHAATVSSRDGRVRPTAVDLARQWGDEERVRKATALADGRVLVATNHWNFESDNETPKFYLVNADGSWTLLGQGETGVTLALDAAPTGATAYALTTTSTWADDTELVTITLPAGPGPDPDPDPAPTDSDGDGVADATDRCAGTVMPEPAPSQWREQRYILHADGTFLDPTGRSAKISVTDTKGCSAHQIIEESGMWSGHLRYGISLGSLRAWTRTVKGS